MDLTTGPAATAGLALAAAAVGWVAQPWLRSRAGLVPLGRRAIVPVGASALAAVLVGAAVGSARTGLLALAALAVITPLLVEADLTQRRLPAALTRPAVALSALAFGVDAAVMGAAQRAAHAVLVGVAAWAVFAALRVVSRGGMGRGDITVAGLLGLQLGWLAPGSAALGLFLGFALVSTVLVPGVVFGMVPRRARVPFGPFLLLGSWTAVACTCLPRVVAASAPTPSWVPVTVLAVGALIASGWALRAAHPAGALTDIPVPPSVEATPVRSDASSARLAPWGPPGAGERS